MIALPISILILVAGSYLIQTTHYSFLERQKTLDQHIHGSGEIEKLRAEFDEYKKRVDHLGLKAGFKL